MCCVCIVLLVVRGLGALRARSSGTAAYGAIVPAACITQLRERRGLILLTPTHAPYANALRPSLSERMGKACVRPGWLMTQVARDWAAGPTVDEPKLTRVSGCGN